MATDVLDEHRFSSQCSLYEPHGNRLSKETKHHETKSSLTTIFTTTSVTSNTRPRREKYSTQSSAPINSVTNNSINHRNSVSNDFLSVIRTFAMKPFRTTSMTNAVTEGQTNNVIGSNHVHAKPPVSLLKYRPLSDSVFDHISYSQPTHVCI
jgi:hypothetical protein